MYPSKLNELEYIIAFLAFIAAISLISLIVHILVECSYMGRQVSYNTREKRIKHEMDEMRCNGLDKSHPEIYESYGQKLEDLRVERAKYFLGKEKK